MILVFMIKQSTLDFLNLLSKNNNKAWFQENRPLYEAAKKDFEGLVMGTIANVSSVYDLGVLTPKDCIFRINRDARFSINKAPYKSNFGAIIARGGKKNMFASFYIHIQPGQSFVGGGLYMPSSKALNKFRDYFLEFPKKYFSIVEDAPFKKFYGACEGDRLKTSPRGYPAGLSDKVMDVLRMKSLVVYHYISDAELLSPDFENTILKGVKIAKPLNGLFIESQLFGE